MRRLRGALHSAMAGEERQELAMAATDRRGKAIRCRVRVSPLLYDGRAPRGAVLVLEEMAEAERDGAQENYLGRVVGASLNEVYSK